MKRKAFFLITGLAVVVVLLVLLAPSDNEGVETKTLRIGVAIYLGDDTFIGNMMKSLDKKAVDYEQETGTRIHLSKADAQSSQTTQNGQIDRFLSMDYDVLCVNLVDRTNASYIIEKAKAVDVPVVFFNREPVQADMLKWDRLYYVGTDAVGNGLMQGEIVVDAYNADPGSIDTNGDGIIQYVMIEGEVRHQDAVLRTENSIKAIRDAGISVEKLDGAIADWERTRANAIATQYFETYQEQIELFICNNDDMALGVIDAVDDLGLDFTNIVGIDGTPAGLEAVRNGRMLGTVVIDYNAQAELIFQAACALAKGEKPEDTMDVADDRSIRAPMYKEVK